MRQLMQRLRSPRYAFAILTHAFAPVLLAILAAVRRMLLSAQTGVLTSAIMFTVVLRLSSLEWWLRLPTLWVPAVLAFLATLFLEVFAAFVWLGRAYDSIDPIESGLCS